MFYEIASAYNKNFTKFDPFASIANRDAYNALDAEWRKESLSLAESFSDYSFPNMLATDFLEFSRTGNRVHYEDKFFKKRLVLDSLILAECVEDKNRFTDQIVNGIFSICEESAWQLPPHNSYEGTPNYPLPDSTEPVLDLFSCETGSIMACSYYLLKNKLDEISPFINKRILSELNYRIYLPYVNRHFWWMGNGRDPMCNWTIWCTQNVLLSAFLNDKIDSELLRGIFLKACRSVDYFLADYGEDGCCDEGAQYYRHAGLCLFQTMEILNAVTDGAFRDLYLEKKIKNIAEYIFNVHVHGPYYINYADCSPIAGRAGVREFLFAERTGNLAMQIFAARDFAAGGLDTLLLPNENNLYYRLQNGFTAAQIKSFEKKPASPSSQCRDTAAGYIPHKDIFYPSVGLFIARDDVFTLAAKAGDNGDSHNHNDTGSFTIYKNGNPLFIDLGVESYSKKTFSDRRYEIWTMQSSYHNLPTIHNIQQEAGKEYGAKVLEYELNKESPRIEMDIAGAYPKEALIEHYLRKVSLVKGKEIIIEDNVTPFSDDIVLNLMTYEKPVPQETACTDAPIDLTLSIGALGTLHVYGASLIRIETIPVTDPRLMTAWNHEVYRIQLNASESRIVMCIR